MQIKSLLLYVKPNPVFDVCAPQRMPLSRKKWELFTCTRLVQRIFAEGYNPLMYFKTQPIQTVGERARIWAITRRDDSETRRTAVQKLVDQGIFEKMPLENEKFAFVATLFNRPKKSGKPRYIHNAKPVNSKRKTKHFKQEHLGVQRQMIRFGDYLTKIDMKDAYWYIYLSEDSKLLFCIFDHNGNILQSTCMIFGDCDAPRIYTQVKAVPIKFFRSKGIRCGFLLDDDTFFESDYIQSLAHTLFALMTYNDLGMEVNFDKSVIIPTRKLEVLGAEIGRAHV
jgi:hypothetical protein